MPVLISNQTSNTNNTEQEELPSNDRQTNHVSSNEPVVREGLIYLFFL
jgi:hypothetical protein